MNIPTFKANIDQEISAILGQDFNIDVTGTTTVPHSKDPAITFPNLVEKTQGTKLIETAVLYIDMRRSTDLSLQHRKHVVAKLYSAFVRSMTQCADAYGGHVRGIIGDRIMVLFNSANCYGQAIDVAVLMNSVCQFVLNKYFTHNEVTFGIGIDHGTMLATKTGIRKQGEIRGNYQSLVWLGRPANVASKLTDIANKPEEVLELDMVRVAYQQNNGDLAWRDERPHEFVKNFTFDASSGMMRHTNPRFHAFYPNKTNVSRVATPPILMSEKFYKGLKAVRPQHQAIVGNWYSPVDVQIEAAPIKIYGGDVHFTQFKPDEISSALNALLRISK